MRKRVLVAATERNCTAGGLLDATSLSRARGGWRRAPRASSGSKPGLMSSRSLRTRRARSLSPASAAITPRRGTGRSGRGCRGGWPCSRSAARPRRGPPRAAPTRRRRPRRRLASFFHTVRPSSIPSCGDPVVGLEDHLPGVRSLPRCQLPRRGAPRSRRSAGRRRSGACPRPPRAAPARRSTRPARGLPTSSR